MSDGYLNIVNVGKGHLEIKFDGSDPEDVETARKAIDDMLKRKYLIIVKDAEGVEHKVDSFDPEKNLYIIKEVGGKKEVPLTEGKATAIAPAAGG